MTSIGGMMRGGISGVVSVLHVDIWMWLPKQAGLSCYCSWWLECYCIEAVAPAAGVYGCDRVGAGVCLVLRMHALVCCKVTACACWLQALLGYQLSV